jgi:polysaccharide export outer membrane protein
MTQNAKREEKRDFDCLLSSGGRRRITSVLQAGRAFPLSLIFLIVAILANISPFPSFTSPSSANLREYTIGPQDVLTIEVWDNPDLSREATVSLKGTFSFPLIGEILVEGYTCEQLQQTIRARLADGYLINPQVTVTVKEYNSKKIYVLGEVNKAGGYPFSRATTMVELIAMAGGMTQDAGQEAYILRPKADSDEGQENYTRRKSNAGQAWPDDLANALEADSLPRDMLNREVVTIKLNDFDQGLNLHFELRNNDTIFIPKAKFFYVIGEVKDPGRFKLEKEVNVLQAISMAGGLTPKANEKKVKILRNHETEDKEITVSLTDTVLPDDIIRVPESFF